MIIIDTSVLIANLVASDFFHIKAQELMEQIASSGQPQAITYGTLIELTRGLYKLSGSDFAAQQASIALGSFEVLFPESIEDILNLYNKKNDVLSFVDCEIITIAKSRGANVVSFDGNLVKTFRQL